jgi:hypothetical protein
VPKQYIQAVLRFWKTHVSGWILAIIAIGLYIAAAYFSGIPSVSAQIIKWSAWLTSGAAFFMVFVAQYDAWKEERTAKQKAQDELDVSAHPVIVVEWGDAETPFQKGFVLRYNGNDPLKNVTIETLSNSTHTASFDIIPFLEKGTPKFLVPRVSLHKDPNVNGDFSNLLDWSALGGLTGLLRFRLAGINQRTLFGLTFRLEGNCVNPDICEVFAED